TVGELQLRGGALMMGFYKVDPSKVFTSDGFYGTNDLVRMEEDGNLYFVARRGDMLKTAGANVSRLEVQAAFATLPEVDLPIVLGLPDPESGQIVVAGIVPKPGTSPTEDYFKAELRKTLSSYKVPKHVLIIDADEVLWTPSNKVKLNEMADVFAAKIRALEATS
ncbi:MAG: long-chain fatty acid--CoA ligase, partial [Alphaproteobacteria bacterium]